MEEGFVRTVFSTGDNEDVQAFINVMKQEHRIPPRESIDRFCKGCGKFGHDIYHQGCDFCAQLSIALKFLEQHPDDVKRVIKDYITHQKKRQANKLNTAVKTPYRKGSSPYKKAQLKATVRSLSYIIETAL